MNEGETYAGGLDLNFFESADFENQQDTKASDYHEIVGRNVLRMLMMGWHDNWRDILSREVLKAIFIERDYKLTKGLRHAFQQGFSHLFTQLHDIKPPSLEFNQVQLYLSNCLAILSSSDLTAYESFTIPEWVNGSWQLVDYKVVPIELTPTSGFNKLFLKDEDRVFAYGLEPITNLDARPHLIFMGTTYVAGQGFEPQVKSDMKAPQTPGMDLYISGEENITHFLDKQPKRNTHVCGLSLGGALAEIVAVHQGEKLSRVDALNPPGLNKSWRKNRFDRWDEQTKRPEVYVQRQGNDPVSKFGVWKKEWNVIKVTPPIDKQGPNGGADHALNYAGFAKTTFTAINVEKDNKARKARDFWIYTVARSIAYYLFLVPFHYVVLPLWRYTTTHKLQLLVTAALIVLFCLLPSLAIPFVIPWLGATLLMVFNAVFSAVIAGFLLNNLIWFAGDLFTGETQSDLSKVISWVASKSTLVKSVFIAGSLMIAAMIIAACVLPPLIPFITAAVVYSVISIPLVIKVMFQISTIIKTLLGVNEKTKPLCQSPYLPRNKSMDTYKNASQATFTFKELGDYYRARRCFLKDREFLPEDREAGSEKFKGISKYDVLKKSEEEGSNMDTITLEFSKAKIYEMKQTAQLINRFGLNRNNKEFMHELEELHSEYSSGKGNRW